MTQSAQTPRFIERVTLMGVDDDLSLESLLALAKDFNFFEIGVQLSPDYNKHHNVSPRYLHELMHMCLENAIPITGRVCDEWAKTICNKGSWVCHEDFEQTCTLWALDRIQIDLTGLLPHQISPSLLGNAIRDVTKAYAMERDRRREAKVLNADIKRPDIILRSLSYETSYFQVLEAVTDPPLDVHPLIDLSRRGSLSEAYWCPRPEYKENVGYAGRYTASTIAEVLQRNAPTHSFGPCWLEIMDGVMNDKDFIQLDEMRKLLDAVKPFVALSADLKRMEEGFYSKTPEITALENERATAASQKQPAVAGAPSSAAENFGSSETVDEVAGAGFGRPNNFHENYYD